MLPLPPDIDIKSLTSKEYIEQVKDGIISDLNTFTNMIDTEIILRIVNALHESQYIYIHDLLKNGMRIPLIRNLALTHKTVTLSYDIDSQCEDAGKAAADSMYLLIYDGMAHSQEIANTIKKVHKNGAKTAVISSRKTFPNIELCDIVLYISKGSSTVSNMLLYDLVYQHISELYKCMYITGKKLV